MFGQRHPVWFRVVVMAGASFVALIIWRLTVGGPRVAESPVGTGALDAFKSIVARSHLSNSAMAEVIRHAETESA